ncbi:MAG: thiamine phosphate synthase [Pseudomonadales bacterium]|nr:thiamine phosphate synthase [Pseudomonadales bacterium]
MITKLKGLYAVTATRAEKHPTDQHLTQLLLAVKSSLEGGTKIIQFRDKDSATEEKLEYAIALKTLCQQYNAALIINDELSIAAELGLGLHLGREDGCIETARKVLGDNAIIGATCHASLDYAEEAAQQGATYLAFGRFFSSTTKPDASPAPLDILTQAKAQFQLPVVAIGGINLDNAPYAISAGADMVAAVDAIYNVPNITETCQKFQALFSS